MSDEKDIEIVELSDPEVVERIRKAQDEAARAEERRLYDE